MRILHVSLFLVAWAVAGLLAGTGFSDSGKASEDEHEESPSGASFKAGKGITLTEETSRILGLTVADVTEETLPNEIRLNVQIFGEHRFELEELEHSGCEVHASGLLSLETAAAVQPKQPVKFLTTTREALDGFVVAVKKGLIFGETEIIAGVTSAGATGKVKQGEFLTAIISLPRREKMTVIPRSALLRTVEGTFVYVVNGGAYLRTAVKVGTHTDDKVEIADGLFAGDQVVTAPVETLWLIELRATKGGGHSH